MMEKRGVIEEGRTPPEQKDARDLAQHVTKRAADQARDSIHVGGKPLHDEAASKVQADA